MPRLVEAAWLYPPGRGALPAACVRLYDVVEADEWEVELSVNDPASHEAARFATEDDARECLAKIYAQGGPGAVWKVRDHSLAYGRGE